MWKGEDFYYIPNSKNGVQRKGWLDYLIETLFYKHYTIKFQIFSLKHGPLAAFNLQDQAMQEVPLGEGEYVRSLVK